VNLGDRAVRIRRSITRGNISTPKSGRGRTISISPSLAADLEALLALRRHHALERGWGEVPPWVFCSQEGTPFEPNLGRARDRLRRRAKAEGIRPLKLHATRHTWATHALRAGKSIRWVAAQLGHADPPLTLRVYAHAMRDEETDLAFTDYAAPIAAKRTRPTHPDGPIRPLMQ
jgi:integrase